jgi:putative addiction module component (TIGR02574 family)
MQGSRRETGFTAAWARPHRSVFDDQQVTALAVTEQPLPCRAKVEAQSADAAGMAPAAMLSAMNARVDHVLEDILRLSAEERSAVAAALIDSLETGDEGSLAEAWRTELLRRRAELRAGTAQAAPWAEVRARISAL